MGTVLGVHQMDLGWFGEGDERFYLDGEDYPSLSGTGTEEYFGDAWGLRPFARPFFGAPLFEGYYPGDRVSAYRWHVHDPVAFKKSLKLTIEHHGALRREEDLYWVGGFYERSDWFSSVAFWYQYPARTFDTPLPPRAERLAPYRVLSGEALRMRATPQEALQDGSYLPGRPDGVLEVGFDIEEAGRYQVNAMMGHFFSGGIYQAFVDGTPVGGPRDYCFAGEDTAWDNFDLHDFAPGAHVLRFEGRGLSPQQRSLTPKQYALRLEQLIILRLEDMAGYQKVLTEVEAKK